MDVKLNHREIRDSYTEALSVHLRPRAVAVHALQVCIKQYNYYAISIIISKFVDKYEAQ